MVGCCRRLPLQRKTVLRAGFTMIELIFAIVLIAVVMLTIPTMIQVNNKALETSTTQEAIFLVSAVLSETTTLTWDTNSLDTSVGAVNEFSTTKVLDTNTTGNAAYYRVDNNSSIRIGHLDQDLHRKMFDVPTYPNQTGKVTLAQTISGTASESVGYKNSYAVVAHRSYVSDNPSLGTAGNPFVFTLPETNVSSIKMTEVEINTTIDGKNSVLAKLRAYTCNIGEVDYAKRSF